MEARLLSPLGNEPATNVTQRYLSQKIGACSSGPKICDFVPNNFLVNAIASHHAEGANTAVSP
jgi:hypothetical protein